jgi:hypothetical protein
MSPLTPERLREVLSYDAETGVFRWKVRMSSRIAVGSEAGCAARYTKGNQYRVIRIDKTLHLAHRLAWLHVHGEWPTDELDHINTDGLDNRISNLRPATRDQNQRNVGITKRNTSGAKGVSLHHTGKWRAKIYAGREYYLGSFATVEEARAAYERAAAKYHGDFARAD